MEHFAASLRARIAAQLGPFQDLSIENALLVLFRRQPGELCLGELAKWTSLGRIADGDAQAIPRGGHVLVFRKQPLCEKIRGGGTDVVGEGGKF